MMRNLLFAPASKPDLLAKLPRAGADGVVLDCEDGTPPARKAEARKHARTVGAQLAQEGVSVWVRVNGVDTPWFDADVTEAIPRGCTGVALPSVESITQVERFLAALQAAGHPDLLVLLGLETALGVADARELLCAAGVSAGYFGAEDFIADVGGVRTPGNAEVAYARSAVALAGRLAEIPVLDQVVVSFGDLERFRSEAAEARALGYAGKLCIHPSQVAVAHEVFTPSTEEIDTARRIVDAYAESKEEVVVVDGRMIDQPLVRQARRTLEIADG